MDRRLAQRLLASLRGVTERRLRSLRFTMMPDFFVDHFVEVGPWKRTMDSLGVIHDRGGGSYPKSVQRLLHGGNAANTALALARLGTTTSLIAATDPVGLAVLRHFAEACGLDIAGVQADGSIAITTAIEFARTGANVMVSQPGSVDGFGPEHLQAADWRRIRESDVVGVVNWALNRGGGTRLAQMVFKEAKKAGATTFLDTADPASRRSDLPELRRLVLRSPSLDVWGLNENELRVFAGSAGRLRPGGELAALRRLKATTAARLDLHTRSFAASVDGDAEAVVDSVPLAAHRRTTGSGDAWNAGDLLGHALGLPGDERLLLAHLCAAHYISAPQPAHATLKDVQRYARWCVRTRPSDGRGRLGRGSPTVSSD